VDIDIRKPDTGTVTIGRPTPVASNQNTDSTTTPDHLPYSPGHRIIPYTEPVSEGEEDEEMAFAIPVNEVGSLRVPLSEGLEAIAFREKALRQQEDDNDRVAQKRRESPAQSSRANGSGRQILAKDKGAVERMGIDPLAPSNVFDQSLQNKLQASAEDQRDENNGSASGLSAQPESDEVRLIRDFVASPGKRIAVPVRIEPKVFFAQERTFLVSGHSSAIL
jgi:hypothetical protein